MNKENTNTVSKLLHPVGLGKRVLAFIIDMMFSLVLAIVVYLAIGQQVIIKNSDYYAQQAAYRENAVSSHLAYEFYCDECKSYFDPEVMVETTNGYNDPAGHTLSKYSDPCSFTMKDSNSDWLDNVKLNNVEMHPYELYEKIIWAYYTDYLPNDAAFNGQTVAGKSYAEYYTKEHLVKEVYGISVDASGNPVLTDDDIYQPAKDAGGNWDYTAQPIVRSEKYDVSFKEIRDKIANYFNDSSSGLYVTALSNLKSQTVYSDPVSKMNVIAYYALLPAVTIPALVFYFIIPLCLKDGKTLGKLFLHLSVVGFDGFKASPVAKILHYIFILVGYEILLIPYTMIAFMVMMLYFALGYMVLVMSKTHQALHDKVAKTIVVDSKTSIWFADQDAKDEYIATHPSSLAAQMDKEAKGESVVGPDGIARVMVADSMPTAEESGVLDLSTIEQFKKQTDNIQSFDEFEKAMNATPEEQPTSEPAKTEVEKPTDEVENDFTDASNTEDK